MKGRERRSPSLSLHSLLSCLCFWCDMVCVSDLLLLSLPLTLLDPSGGPSPPEIRPRPSYPFDPERSSLCHPRRPPITRLFPCHPSFDPGVVDEVLPGKIPLVRPLKKQRRWLSLWSDLDSTKSLGTSTGSPRFFRCTTCSNQDPDVVRDWTSTLTETPGVSTPDDSVPSRGNVWTHF